MRSIRLPQSTWFTIFDYAFAILLALGYGAIFRWFEVPWWFASPVIAFEVMRWARRA